MLKFEEYRLTLNYEKCVIGAKSIEYMEVRSFLGSAKFILPMPNLCLDLQQYEARCGTLHATGKSWKWSSKEESFEQIKKLLSNTSVMAYFAKDAKTLLVMHLSVSSPREGGSGIGWGF